MEPRSQLQRNSHRLVQYPYTRSHTSGRGPSMLRSYSGGAVGQGRHGWDILRGRLGLGAEAILDQPSLGL